MRRTGLPILLSLTIAAFAAAQPGPPPRPGEPPPGRPEGGDDLRATVEIYMVHRMKEALDLDEKQSLQVLDLLQERRESMQAVHEGRRELMKTTHALLADEGATEGEFRKALREEEELRRQEMKVQDGFREGLARILSSRQQLQFQIFERRFEEGMRRRIEQMRQGEERDRRGQRQRRLEHLRQTDPERYRELQQRRREKAMEEIREEQ
jgi:hypothetical protein